MFLREAFYVLPGFYWERSPRERIEKRQVKKLNTFLDNARAAVPFYKNNDTYNRKITSLDDMNKFPVLNKAIVRDAGSGIHNEKYCKPGKARALPTSGTTGEPMTYFHDERDYARFSGANVRKVMATKKYSPFFITLHITILFNKKKGIYERFGLFRRNVVASYLKIDELKKIILDTRPDCLVAYPVYVGDIVAAMTEEELEEARKFIKCIFTESETLPRHLRDYIQDSLDVEIFEDYASHDSLSITYECSHHRHHIVEDRIYLEILDDEGRSVPDGVEGNIVITSYLERAMPMLRYSSGDKGIRSSEPCPCGRTFRTLRLTKARANDCIYLKNGLKIYSSTLVDLPTYIAGLRQLHVRQNVEGEITVYCVPFMQDGSDNESIIAFVLQYFKEHFNVRPNVEITCVIPRTKGGKAQLMHSEMTERNDC